MSTEEAGLTTLAMIPGAELAEIGGGRMSEALKVRLNRPILDYDHLLICGPAAKRSVLDKP